MNPVLLAALVWCASSLVGAPPDVSAILEKLAANADNPAVVEARDGIRYERVSRIDYLSDENTLKKQVIRRYTVSEEEGRPVSKLISVNGKPPSGDEEEHRSSARRTGDKSRSLSLSADLLSRYEFSLAGQETLNGRPAWMLRFRPKSGADADGFFDRLVNAMSGIIWVDIEDGQLAKAEIFLSKKVSFFGGLAGAIERMDLTLVQRRIEPNVWLGESTFIDFSGRKLFSSIRFRCYETCSDFHRAAQALSEGLGR